ncbi:MAG: hypothetical protein E4H27_06140, partial [Anaerolineales bacterium]
MQFPCIHHINTPADAVGRHLEYLNSPVDKCALLLVNVYGLLLPVEHSARQSLVEIYGAEEISHRESLVRTNLLPVMG